MSDYLHLVLYSALVIPGFIYITPTKYKMKIFSNIMSFMKKF